MISKFLMLSVILITCTSCAPVTLTDEELDNQLADSIAMEKSEWKELNIINYQVEIRHDSIWGDFNLMVMVKNNKIEAFDGKCGQTMQDFDQEICTKISSELPSDIYIIDKMFEKLEESRTDFETDFLQYSAAKWNESMSISFSAQHHYPEFIRFDIPNITNEEYTIEILSFRILAQ
jgi:hypothetical protein